MIIGQSLCDECRLTQIPFTRGSGDLLDYAVSLAGLKKSDLFITNVVHCHPPGNRASSKDETQNCKRFLIREFRLVKPKLVIALGADAKHALTSTLFLGCYGEQFKPQTNAVRFGKSQRVREVISMWVYHPAYFLYQSDKKLEARWLNTMEERLREYA